MFYHLEGIISELTPNLAVVDCGGVGYAVNITMNTAASLKLGERHKLYISESIGENNFDLFGFSAKNEKCSYEMLVSVSGIGPKAAMSILSHCTPESLALSVMNNDIKALTLAPGIGKKIAQRVILELKDKISKEMGDTGIEFHSTAVAAATADSSVNDAMTALAVLGYSSAEIAPVIKTIDVSGMSAEQIIKTVLKQMVK